MKVVEKSSIVSVVLAEDEYETLALTFVTWKFKL